MYVLYNTNTLHGPRLLRNTTTKPEQALLALLRERGWTVEDARVGSPDLLISRGPHRYAVQLKASARGRADRVIPLLAQGILQSRRHAAAHAPAQPLALVLVDRLTPTLRERAAAFHAEYAPESALGLVADDGGRWFFGPGLDDLCAQPAPAGPLRKHPVARRTHDLFSDLHQWLLKVLLAPELPEHLLHAPRHDYRTATGLAEAAGVSAMSVSRLLRRLREEGFLDETSATLRLVRRTELFRRWLAAAGRATPEMPMRFLLPETGEAQLRRVAAAHPEACIGLFAAARLLELAHVADTVPWLYLRRLPSSPQRDWPELVAAAPGEPVQLILKQAAAPEALFRAAVRIRGNAVADVLQVWLDVSSHPTRGREQADFLARTVLAGVLGDGR